MRLPVHVAILLTVALAGAAVAQPQPQPRPGKADDDRCLQCHGQAHIAQLGPLDRQKMVGTRLQPGAEAPAARPNVLSSPPPPETRPGLYVRREIFAKTVHADVACVECHEQAALLPHEPVIGTGICAAACHAEEVERFSEGAHGRAYAEGDPQAPACATCHGGHEIVKVAGRDSPVSRMKSVLLCADCHEQHEMLTPGGYSEDAHISNYLASTHGRALSESGLVAAAMCVDCHAHHDVQPASDPRSLVHRDRVPETCGACHPGIIDQYAKSIHGQRLSEGDPDAPVCVDCHTAHSISRADASSFMLDVVNECGSCHDNAEESGTAHGTKYRTYRASYHGQVTRLGSTRAARCSDCHGSHDIARNDDPRSMVHPDNLVSTCGQGGCHEGANANFVKFDPHADYRDAKRYPILFGVWIYFIVIISVTLGFYGIHTLLWFLRSFIERRKGGPPKRHRHVTAIRRFSLLDRVNHAFVAITFLGLVATGIPLAFSAEPWARGLSVIFGGIELAGVWHRIFGFMLILNLLAHAAGLVVSFRKRQGSVRQWLLGPGSLVPKWRDVTDCLGMFRWFLRGREKPRFDRWTYFEKFDYWCEIAGSAIIGTSGLLLLMPVVASSFLPGWAFNVAMIVHGYEALLALGFIFTIHFFNANLRPEKFPVDEVIFSGVIPEEELAEERPDEYARLIASGSLESLRAPVWPAWKSRLAKTIGILAMAFAVTLLVLIIMAGLRVD